MYYSFEIENYIQVGEIFFFPHYTNLEFNRIWLKLMMILELKKIVK